MQDVKNKNTAGKTPHDLLSAVNQKRDWDVPLGPTIFELAGGDDKNFIQVMRNAKNKNERAFVAALEFEGVMINDGPGKVVTATPLYHAVFKGNQAVVIELLRHNVDLTKNISYAGTWYSIPHVSLVCLMLTDL